METDTKTLPEDVLDLGDVSELTRGPDGNKDDLMGGLRTSIGIAED
ncbi:benenodin family lasso peptide [Sphingobium sp. H39-3-25]|nr:MULTISPECIES: benenodin family lasso peptide [Sphingomonadaceae]MDF0491132.1 benenodin family lasso peptide [Sphingomonas pollutisoli]MDF0545136.1 benenodin family lasso peptide [Sphingobium arseniciresistens]